MQRNSPGNSTRRASRFRCDSKVRDWAIVRELILVYGIRLKQCRNCLDFKIERHNIIAYIATTTYMLTKTTLDIMNGEPLVSNSRLTLVSPE